MVMAGAICLRKTDSLNRVCPIIRNFSNWLAGENGRLRFSPLAARSKGGRLAVRLLFSTVRRLSHHLCVTT